MSNKEFFRFLSSVFITVMAGYATMLVDATIGGRYIGEAALSAVNLLMPVNEVFSAVAILLGAGANTALLWRWGVGTSWR